MTIDALERDLPLALDERPSEDASGTFTLPIALTLQSERPTIPIRFGAAAVNTTPTEMPASDEPAPRRRSASSESLPTPIQAGMVVASHLRLGETSSAVSAAPAAQAAPPSASAPAQAKPILGITVGDQSAGSIRLTVRHPILGAVDMELVMSGRDVAATATVTDARGQAALRASESGLRAALSEAGMTLRAMSVEVRPSSKSERKRKPNDRKNQEK